MAATSPSSSSPPPTFPPSFSPTSPSSPRRSLSQAAVRSRSPPLTPLPALSTTVPGLTPFDRAVHVVNVSNRAIADTHTLLNSSTGSSSSSDSSSGSDVVSFTPEEQLLLYGAYKQATKGDVRGIKPTLFEMTARSKWQAWANMRGKTTAEAQDTYVDLVVGSLTKPGSHPDHHLLSEEITQRPSRSSSPTFSTLNAEKELPPVLDQDSSSSSSASPSTVDSVSSPSLHPPSTREGSFSHSIRSTATEREGLRSAATSVYELASDNIVDSEAEDNDEALNETTDNNDLGYREITETVVEEEILDDEAYEAEVQKSRPVSMQVGQDRMQEKTKRAKDEAIVSKLEEHDEKEDGRDNNNDDDDDSDNSNDDDDDGDDVYQSSEEYDASEQEERIKESRPSSHLPPAAPMPSPQPRRQDADVKEFVDEGVFDAEDEDEVIKEDEGKLIDELIDVKNQETPQLQDGASDIATKELKESGSPKVEPYRVFSLHNTTTSPEAEAPVILERPNNIQRQPAVHHSLSAPSLAQPSSMEGLVCPVSKKTAASGAMCPAAMFAQARTSAASGTVPATETGRKTPTNESNTVNEPTDRSQSSSLHQRSVTEPASTNLTVEPTRPISSSAVNAATSQGKRIGQGIVSRFSALRSSLAAASARATSSALSAGSSSVVPKNPNAVVVRDQVTNQPVTVVCPHLVSTQLLETEVVRLQTDISVLHERLDLLQESLKIKSQTQALERRSARGILKLILRQGLINAVLLLIVFAVLYKRKSPIAFAILAYVGQGRKEGEAGWRALMRWTADLVRRGQRNQQYVLNAGRRNGYW